MQRVRMTVRYDGTGFAGSQVQPEGRTVAGTLKDGLESVLDHSVHLLFAGRTDAGVHADGNVAACDVETKFPVEKLPELVNHRLPEDLSVRDVQVVPQAFHPRFDAKLRTYVYRVYRGDDVPVDRARYTAHYPGDWDGVALSEAMDHLAGEHSFNEYCQGLEEPQECVCRLRPVVVRELDDEIWWCFSSDRFLRNMICRLAGALLLVAGGKITPSQLQSALITKMDFKLKPAPAKGLTLLRVDY